MSIIRVGLGENPNFAEGYEAIFGKKKEPAKKKTTTKAKSEKPTKKSKKK